MFMPESEIPETTPKTYEIRVVLEERTDDKHRKIISQESLGSFVSEKEARQMIELVELPDLDHIIVI